MGIDVGGTKTLVAALNDGGEILEHDKFPTPKDYDDFLKQLDQVLSHFMHHDFQAGGAGLPGRLNRDKGLIVRLGNLPWLNEPIQKDLEAVCRCPIVIENDAKMGGLSEAMLLKDRYQKVLYVAIGTGIGVALINKGVIDTNIADGGGHSLTLEHRGKFMPWEEFAAGRAIAERYGKPAHDISDEKTWRAISRYLAQGLIHYMAVTDPEVIVLGGSVGSYFDRYGAILKEELQKYNLPLITLPELVGAQRPEEAVVYGCYDLAKQVYGRA